MKHSDFIIGFEFYLNSHRWRVTDIGSRVVVAIKVDPLSQTYFYEGEQRTDWMSKQQAKKLGWLNGPPYAVEEVVMDENDFDACYSVPDYLFGIERD